MPVQRMRRIGERVHHVEVVEPWKHLAHRHGVAAPRIADHCVVADELFAFTAAGEGVQLATLRRRPEGGAGTQGVGVGQLQRVFKERRALQRALREKGI